MCDGSRETSDGSQPFADMKRGLQLLLRGDVADDLRRTDYASALISYGRDRERNIDSISILLEPYRLKVFNSFTRPYLCENHILVIQELPRNKVRDRSTDNLCRLISEDALRAPIPVSDDSVQVLADNCVIGRLDDCCHAIQGKLGLFLFRDVGSKAACVNELAVPDENVGINANIANGAVFASETSLVTMQLFIAAKAFKDVSDHRNIGMKFGDVPADILTPFVA